GLFSALGHDPAGLALRGAWPAGVSSFPGIERLSFLSASPGYCPPDLRFFPVEVKPLREGLKAGMTLRAWAEAAKSHIRACANRERSLTRSHMPQPNPDQIRRRTLQGADEGHLQTAAPPGPHRHQALGGSYGKMGREGNRRGDFDGGQAAHEKERDHRNERSD